LEKDPANRLGTKAGIEDILAHPWLASMDFQKLVGK